jgi:hypothetical protein
MTSASPSVSCRRSSLRHLRDASISCPCFFSMVHGCTHRSWGLYQITRSIIESSSVPFKRVSNIERGEFIFSCIALARARFMGMELLVHRPLWLTWPSAWVEPRLYYRTRLCGAFVIAEWFVLAIVTNAEEIKSSLQRCKHDSNMRHVFISVDAARSCKVTTLIASGPARQWLGKQNIPSLLLIGQKDHLYRDG